MFKLSYHYKYLYINKMLFILIFYCCNQLFDILITLNLFIYLFTCCKISILSSIYIYIFIKILENIGKINIEA